MEYKGISQHIDFCRLPTPGGRYELTQVLGVGTYGEVYRAKGITHYAFNAFRIILPIMILLY